MASTRITTVVDDAAIPAWIRPGLATPGRMNHLVSALFIAVGLVSMLGFVALALGAGDYGTELRRVVLIDVVASALLLAAARLRGATASP